MSLIFDPTTPQSSEINPDGGLDIVGFEDSQNRFNGTENNDNIIGGNVGNAIDGAGGDDVISVGGGLNLLFGNDGNDVISGGFETDHIRGDAGNDLLEGNEGDDIVHGGEGTDTINGGDGNDVLSGGDSVGDILDGEAGNDQLVGRMGQVLTGGTGADVFILEFFGETDTNPMVITDFNGSESDEIWITGVGSDASVSYDSTTGQVNVNGQNLINLEPGLDVTDEDFKLF